MWCPCCVLLLLLAIVAGIPPAHAGKQTLFVTSADGSEGYRLSHWLLLHNSSAVNLIAGVDNPSCNRSQELRRRGAKLFVGRPTPDVFRNMAVDWILLLPPLTDDRLQVTIALIDASAGVANALLLSLIDADDPNGPASFTSYLQMERHLFNHSRTGAPGLTAVLRTYFYQQNLELWSSSVRSTGGVFELPFHTCFAPLYEMDVAAVVAALMVKPKAELTATFGSDSHLMLNLTGPRVMTANELAQAASLAISGRYTSKQVSKDAAAGIVGAAGLSASEATLVVDLLEHQTTDKRCRLGPSTDVQQVTSRPPTDISVFFQENAALFETLPDT